MTPSPYPIPSIKIPLNFVPKTPADFQELQLLHQIQNGTLPSLNILILNEVLHLPFLSIEIKLGIYHFLTSLPFVSSVHLSTGWFAIVGLMFPLLMWGVLALFIVLIVLLIRKVPEVVVYILGKFNKVVEEKAFLELTFPSSATKSAYATEQLYKLLNTRAKKQGFFLGLIRHKKVYSLEILSSRDTGIVFMLVVPKKEAELLHHTLITFLPGLKVKEVEDYLISSSKTLDEAVTGVIELKQGADFVLPLQDQKALEEHDPISFLLGTMTKLDPGELIAFQIVTTPIIHSVQSKVESRLRKIRLAIARGEPLTPLLQRSIFDQLSSFWPLKIIGFLFIAVFWILKFTLFAIVTAIVEFTQKGSKGVTFFGGPKVNIHMTSDPFEKELHEIVRDKVSQHLFETSIRILIASENEMEFESRADSITSSLGQFTTSNQSLTGASSILPSSFIQNKRMANFKKRSLSSGLGSSTNPILSASEMADLYHFPNTDLTKVEGLAKHKSRDLPAPLSLKQSTTKMDVIIGLNEYGNEIVPIGLTQAQRQQHTYIVGKTGMGKTTIIKTMALQDILSGKGVAVIDPHGDMVEELLTLIPKNRMKDVVYLNPADKSFPPGLNILSPGTSFDDWEEEHTKIARSLMSVFQKITPVDKWGQRMEHILRNATLTALLVPSPTKITPYISLMTIQKLLSDRNYQRNVTANIKDPVLKQFWNKEWQLSGTRQQSEAISPLTNKIGEFITDYLSRYILLQEQSTINIQEIMDSGKILLVNLSKGKLNEERSAFFGTVIISLIQLATYARESIPEPKRADFFVYIDEFQNFATPHFLDLFSEARKYHVFFIASHQNIAQLDDVKTPKIISSNSGNIIIFKSGPEDEDFILRFMEPEVDKGEIINLSPHHFFMKTTTDTQEDAFSGMTVPIKDSGSEKTAQAIVDNSRKNYATPRSVVEKQLKKLFDIEDEEEEKEPEEQTAKNAVNGANKNSERNVKIRGIKSGQNKGRISKKQGV